MSSLSRNAHRGLRMYPELRQLEDQVDVPDQASHESKLDDPPTNLVHGLPKQARDKKHEETQ